MINRSYLLFLSAQFVMQIQKKKKNLKDENTKGYWSLYDKESNM